MNARASRPLLPRYWPRCASRVGTRVAYLPLSLSLSLLMSPLGTLPTAAQAQTQASGTGAAASRFRGEEEPLDRVAGHVPGAVNRPYAINLVDGRFKPPVQLAEEFRALLGTHAPSDVVVMCGSGVTACHNLLAMERAGFKGAKLFTGSWSGWISDPSRRIATGE